MKYCPQFRIEFEQGKVYEFDEERNAYLFHSCKASYTKREWNDLIKKLEDYDKLFDKE